jgi:hypothetical protein
VGIAERKAQARSAVVAPQSRRKRRKQGTSIMSATNTEKPRAVVSEKPRRAATAARL